MVEYSFRQLMAICSSVMEFCIKERMTDMQLDLLRIRLQDPKANGEISFDLGLPKGVPHPLINNYS